MDISALQAFLAVAESGSFSRAAERIYLTQPAISKLSGAIAGELLVATSHHIGLHRLPGLLKRFHETYTQVRLNLQFMDSEKACQAVARGDLELAVVTLPPKTAAPLKTEKIWDDPLDIVVSPGHPLAREKRVKLAKLLE